MTFESYPKSTSMREPNYEQSEKYSIANDDYTVFSVIPLGLRNTPLRITRFCVHFCCCRGSHEAVRIRRVFLIKVLTVFFQNRSVFTVSQKLS